MDVFAFAIFTLVITFTPGPNNLMGLSSGVHFGFKKSLPFMLGVSVGYTAIVLMVSIGMGTIFLEYPFLSTILKTISGAYLLYVAYQIATAPPPETLKEKKSRKSFSFWEAVFLQLVNPKTWIAAINTLSVFFVPTDSYLWQMGWIFSLSLSSMLASVMCWTAFGTLLKTFLSDPKKNRIFNVSMAIILVVSFFTSLF